MKVKNTRDYFYGLRTALNKLSDLEGVKFAYAINRNKTILDAEVKAINEAKVEKEDFQAYEKARIELVEAHAKKDKEGKPVILGNQYQIADQKKFDKEIAKLQKEHKKSLDNRQKQIDELNNFIKEEVELELYGIKLENVPENISVEKMGIITPLIEE